MCRYSVVPLPLAWRHVRLPVRRDTSQRLCRRAGLVREVARLPAIVLSPRHRGRVGTRRAPVGVHRPAAGTARRGLEPAQRETYPNGVRKITYVDPDGNEIGFGGVPR